MLNIYKHTALGKYANICIVAIYCNSTNVYGTCLLYTSVYTVQCWYDCLCYDGYFTKKNNNKLGFRIFFCQFINYLILKFI